MDPPGGDLTGTYPSPTIKSSVALSGSPTTTTQSTSDESTKIATTAYVKAKIDAVLAASDAMIFKGHTGHWRHNHRAADHVQHRLGVIR